MVNYQIRDALAGEHATINALAVDAWRILEPGYDPGQWAGMLTAVGNMANLAGKGQLIVASVKDRILGAVAYMPPGASNPEIFPEGWPSIRMLVTRPNYRNLGIGRHLTEECIRRAGQDGATCIGLHTSPVMSVALPLYLRLGFVKDRDLSPIAGAEYARYILRF